MSRSFWNRTISPTQIIFSHLSLTNNYVCILICIIADFMSSQVPSAEELSTVQSSISKTWNIRALDFVRCHKFILHDLKCLWRNKIVTMYQKLLNKEAENFFCRRIIYNAVHVYWKKYHYRDTKVDRRFISTKAAADITIFSGQAISWKQEMLFFAFG